MIYIIFIYFFAVCETKITVNITTAPFSYKTIIKYAGDDVKLITDKEIILFNITKGNLNEGVKVELGKIPDNIFLKDPTPNNLFRKYKWPEVKRKLKVKSATVIKFMKKDVVLRTHVFVNNSTDTIKTRVDLIEVMENIVSFTWSKEGLPEDEIYFDLNVDFGNGNFSFVQKWRNEKLKSIRLPVNTSKAFMENEAGNTLTSNLIATKIILLVEVEFQACLMGNVITDYKDLYGKYHYYSPTVQNIMKAGKIKNEILSTTLLELRFYMDVRLKVLNEVTGKTLNFENKRKRKMKIKDILKLKSFKRAEIFSTPT